MSTASVRRPGGWASLLSLFLCLDLAACQTGTYKLTSTPPYFQGFFVANPTSIWEASCSTTLTWVTSSTYGNCCLSSSCRMYTACKSGTLTLEGGSQTTCADSLKCVTRTVFPSSPYVVASTSWLRIACGAENFSVNTVYREIVPTGGSAVTHTLTADGTTITVGPSSSSSSSKSSSTNPQTSEPEAEPGADPAQGADRSQPTGTPAQPSPPAPPPAAATTGSASASKAWIAGAVIGPLVALAALGFLFFWLGKRRGDGKMGAGGAGGRAELEQQPYDAGNPPLYDPPPEKHEMPVNYQGPAGHPPVQVHELASAPMLPQELASEMPRQELAGRWR